VTAAHKERPSRRIKHDLSRTKAALEAFDAHAAEHGFRRDGKLAEAVGEAFGMDTAGLNDLATCKACVRPGKLLPAGHPDESFVRRMVRAWEQQVQSDGARK
jgi:hypothetical protein